MSGYCGDPVCAARVDMRRALPNDSALVAPCPRCAAAAVNTRLVEQHAAEDWDRVLRSVASILAVPL